jgi:hypothetical protein
VSQNEQAGRSYVTGLTSVESPKGDILNICKVGSKLGYVLFSLTCSYPPCVIWLLSYRPPKSRRDLWNTLYKNIETTTFRKMAPSSGDAYSDGSYWSSWSQSLDHLPKRCGFYISIFYILSRTMDKVQKTSGSQYVRCFAVSILIFLNSKLCSRFLLCWSLLFS